MMNKVIYDRNWKFEEPLGLQTPCIIDRKPGQTLLIKDYKILMYNNRLIAYVKEVQIINHPSFLQKYRNVIIKDGNYHLIDTSTTNRYISMDINGNITFSKEVELICYF